MCFLVRSQSFDITVGSVYSARSNLWEHCKLAVQLRLLVTYWLKHWTTDRKVQGSSPTSSRDLFLFWVHSALPQKLSRRFSFASFIGDRTFNGWSRGTP